MSLEQYANNAATTLAAAISSSMATSISVSSATGFPSSGNFRILIDSEYMIVTGVSGTTWTVTRGAEGSTAATHSDGATVTHILTAASLEQLVADRLEIGAYGSLPSAGVANRLYLPTDKPVASLDNGSAWAGFGPLFPLTQPNLTGYSWVNQGDSGSITQTNSYVYMQNGPGSGAEDWALYVKSVASAPYTYTVGFLPLLVSAQYSELGVVLYNSSSGKFISLSMQADQYSNSPPGMVLINAKWSSTSSFNASYNFQHGAATLVPWYAGFVFFRIYDDGTERHWQYSSDGVNFLTLAQQSNTDYITPDSIGFGIDCYNSSIAVGMTILHLAG